MKQETNQECIDICNELLRGEMSAVETYDQAIDKFAGEPSAATLRQIKQDHEKSVALLRQNVSSMGGSPSDDSGAWGTFAKTVTQSARLLGENAAVAALTQGEKMGLDNYKDALNNDDVLEDCKAMIRTQLLPKQQMHLATLENLPH